MFVKFNCFGADFEMEVPIAEVEMPLLTDWDFKLGIPIQSSLMLILLSFLTSSCCQDPFTVAMEAVRRGFNRGLKEARHVYLRTCHNNPEDKVAAQEAFIKHLQSHSQCLNRWGLLKLTPWARCAVSLPGAAGSA